MKEIVINEKVMCYLFRNLYLFPIFFFLLIFNGKFLTIIVKSVEKLSSVFAK